jgi:hypothetical protein
MLCEKCSQEIEAVTCNSCGTNVVELGRFCYCCGHELHAQNDLSGTPEERGREGSSDTIDFSARILCSDGACIGVVNEQGVCKVCGKPYTPES